MRSQLNELSKIAKDLKDLLADHHGIINSPIEVSDNIRVTTVNVDYMSVSFNRFPSKLEVNVYCTDKFNQTNVIIDIDRISDEDLDVILLRSKEEIVAFKRLFEQQVVAKRRIKILELQAELEKLSDDERAI
jgi:myo-inositol-1-phosphate synthase